MSYVQQLEDRVAELEDALGLTEYFPDEVIPREVFIGRHNGSKTIQKIASIILHRNFGNREAIYSAIYGGRPESDQPDIKVIDVLMVKLRAGLRPHGIEVKTSQGYGWYFDKESKEKLWSLIAVAKARRAA